jgi:hypothetical protein
VARKMTPAPHGARCFSKAALAALLAHPARPHTAATCRPQHGESVNRAANRNRLPRFHAHCSGYSPGRWRSRSPTCSASRRRRETSRRRLVSNNRAIATPQPAPPRADGCSRKFARDNSATTRGPVFMVATATWSRDSATRAPSPTDARSPSRPGAGTAGPGPRTQHQSHRRPAVELHVILPAPISHVRLPIRPRLHQPRNQPANRSACTRGQLCVPAGMLTTYSGGSGHRQ